MKNKYYYNFIIDNLKFVAILNEEKIITYLNIEEETNIYGLIEVLPDDLVVNEFRQYLSGNLKTFSFDYKLCGTNFQRQVWDALKGIHYGETISYLELSKRIGNKKAVRAVASAVAKNPIVIVIPCHRIIKSDGQIGEYSAGGPIVKKKLIELEKKVSSH